MLIKCDNSLFWTKNIDYRILKPLENVKFSYSKKQHSNTPFEIQEFYVTDLQA